MSYKKNIIFLSQLPPPIHGAAVVSKSIIESTIITAKYDFDIINITTAASIDDINHFSIQKIYRTFKKYFLIFKKCSSNNYHAAYITPAPTGNSFFKDSLYLLIIKIFKIPTIVHLHGKGLRRITEQSWIHKKIGYAVFNNVSIIHLSKLLFHDVEVLPYKNIYSLSNGAPIRNYEYRQIQHSEQLNLLFLSHISKSKGIVDFIESLKLLKEQNILFTASIIGTPLDVDISTLNKLIELNNLQHDVNYLGGVFGEEKEKLLLKANILVLPTYNDCFPIVILEAMRAGLVVISTQEGAIPEIIDDERTGFLVNKQSPFAIVQKIKLLHENRELLQTMSINAQNKFEEKYTSKKFEENFIEIIDNIIQINDKEKKQ